MTLRDRVREHDMAVHAEWMRLPGYKPDLDAAVREMEFVGEYVRAFHKLPPHAQGEVEWHEKVSRFRQQRRRGGSIFDLVIA